MFIALDFGISVFSQNNNICCKIVNKNPMQQYAYDVYCLKIGP